MAVNVHCISGSNWNLESVGFYGEGKTGVPGEKPLEAEKRTNNKRNPHMTPRPGIEPGPHGWEVSALTTAPSLLSQAIPRLIRHNYACMLRPVLALLIRKEGKPIPIRSDERLKLQTSAFRIPVRWSIYIINSVDKTKIFVYNSPTDAAP